MELGRQTGGIDTPADNDYTPTFRVQPPTPATYDVLVGRDTIALTPIEGHFTTTPHTDTPKNTGNQDPGRKPNKNNLDPKDTGYPSQHTENKHLSLTTHIHTPPPPEHRIGLFFNKP